MRIILTMLLNFILLILTACTTFGVDNKVWESMSQQERQVTIDNYYREREQERIKQAEIDKINAQNAPINNVISALTNNLNNNNNRHEQCVTDHFGKTICGYNCYVDDMGSGHCAHQ